MSLALQPRDSNFSYTTQLPEMHMSRCARVPMCPHLPYKVSMVIEGGFRLNKFHNTRSCLLSTTNVTTSASTTNNDKLHRVFFYIRLTNVTMFGVMMSYICFAHVLHKNYGATFHYFLVLNILQYNLHVNSNYSVTSIDFYKRILVAAFIISVSINSKPTYRGYTSVCCSQCIIITWCVHFVTFMTFVVLTWKTSMTFVVIWCLLLMLRFMLWHLSWRKDNSECCDIFDVCRADRGQFWQVSITMTFIF